METTEGEAEATVESPREVRSQVAEADKVNGADGNTPTNRHPGSRQWEERNPCVSSEEETLWETELHTQREEKRMRGGLGTREERGGQGSVRVGGQAALNMEADGAKTPEGKGERVCREDKKVRGRNGVVVAVRKFRVQYQRW